MTETTLSQLDSIASEARELVGAATTYRHMQPVEREQNPDVLQAVQDIPTTAIMWGWDFTARWNPKDGFIAVSLTRPLSSHSYSLKGEGVDFPQALANLAYSIKETTDKTRDQLLKK